MHNGMPFIYENVHWWQNEGLKVGVWGKLTWELFPDEMFNCCNIPEMKGLSIVQHATTFNLPCMQCLVSHEEL